MSILLKNGDNLRNQMLFPVHDLVGIFDAHVFRILIFVFKDVDCYVSQKRMLCACVFVFFSVGEISVGGKKKKQYASAMPSMDAMPTKPELSVGVSV